MKKGAIIVVMALTTVIVPAAAQALLIGGPFLIRSADGTVACVISLPSTAAQQTRDEMTVLVRGPANPSLDALATVPGDMHDFSALPIRVILLSESQAEGAPREQLPSGIDALAEYPIIEGTRSSVAFARVRFSRASLVAGATILGERSIALQNRQRITSHTTCKITEADAAQWR